MDRITPIELERVEIKTCLRGYDRDTVDDLLNKASAEIERLLGENQYLRSEYERARTEVESFKSKESMLTEALMLAQKTADETRSAAHREAELIIQEARLQAQAEHQELRQQANSLSVQIDQLKQEKQKFLTSTRSMLQNYLKDLPSGFDVAEAA